MNPLNKYFIIAFDKKLANSQGFLRKDMVLYCYHKANNQYYFKDTYTAHLAIILSEVEVNLYLVETDVNTKPIFKRHAKDIADELKWVYSSLPTSAKYVIDDIEHDEFDSAYDILCTEADKIRGSFLDESLKLHCIRI